MPDSPLEFPTLSFAPTAPNKPADIPRHSFPDFCPCRNHVSFIIGLPRCPKHIGGEKRAEAAGQSSFGDVPQAVQRVRAIREKNIIEEPKKNSQWDQCFFLLVRSVMRGQRARSGSIAFRLNLCPDHELNSLHQKTRLREACHDKMAAHP